LITPASKLLSRVLDYGGNSVWFQQSFQLPNITTSHNWTELYRL